eukprot:gene27584-49219_t
MQQVPHRAHWQPVEYNALHGGMERWFAPMEPDTVAQPVWRQLLAALAGVSDAVFAGPQAPVPWFVEAHQFRIDTTNGIGRPTPEGAHRDGVDMVAVFLVDRQGVKGGETRVFEAAGPNGQRFTLTEPWSLLLLDDPRVVHESTPIQPVADGGHRDTLVVTLRAGGAVHPMSCTPEDLNKRCQELAAKWQACMRQAGLDSFVEFAVSVSSLTEFLESHGLSGLHQSAHSLEQKVLSLMDQLMDPSAGGTLPAGANTLLGVQVQEFG